MNAECRERTAERGTGSILVCFAVRDEAKHFRPPPGVECRVIVSGIGARNAERALTSTLESFSPRLVLTCGYAGGLNPLLAHGRVVFDADPCRSPITTGGSDGHPPNTNRTRARPGQISTDSTPPDDLLSQLVLVLTKLGALPAKFNCSERIAVTVADKQALWTLTQADAVEMESGIIRSLCRRKGIPSATVRVISDDARQSLPLDFNQLARADGSINYLKLAVALVKSPGLVPKLMRFQRELDLCSRKLAGTLQELLGQLPLR